MISFQTLLKQALFTQRKYVEKWIAFGKSEQKEKNQRRRTKCENAFKSRWWNKSFLQLRQTETQTRMESQKVSPQNLKSFPPPLSLFSQSKARGKVKGQRVESARVEGNLIRMHIGTQVGNFVQLKDMAEKKGRIGELKKGRNSRHAKCTGKRNCGKIMMMTGYTQRGTIAIQKSTKKKIINHARQLKPDDIHKGTRRYKGRSTVEESHNCGELKFNSCSFL